MSIQADFEKHNRKKNADKLLKAIEKAVSATTLIEGYNTDGFRVVQLWGKQYSIAHWDAKVYEEAQGQALSVFPKNDPDLVKQWFAGAIADICTSDDREKAIQTKIESLLEDLNGWIKTRTTCIPIQGIDFRIESLDLFFGKVLRKDTGTLPRIIDDGVSIISHQHTINALNDCPCYLEIKTTSDHRGSITRARELAGYACALLCLFVGSSSYREWKNSKPWYREDYHEFAERKRKISIWGEESGDSTVYYEFCTNGSFSKAQYELTLNYITPGHDGHEALNQHIKYLAPEEVTPSYHLIDEHIANDIVSPKNSLLLRCADKKTPFQKSVFRSVSWFGKAVNADSNEQQFLFFAIALECLLTGADKIDERISQGSITQKISERAAFITSEDLDIRRSTARMVANLYRIRNKIVHAGETIDSDDVLRIENITRELIFKISEKNFRSFEELIAWVETKRYS